MKKKYVAASFIVLLLCSLIFLGISKSNKIKEDTTLRNRIIETVEKSSEIDFSKITDFEWDKMYIFPPYSTPKDILKKDGINSRNSNFSIEVSDVINMIGFVNADRLVSYVELPRNYGGVDLTNYIKLYREETKFSIAEDKKAILFMKK